MCLCVCGGGLKKGAPRGRETHNGNRGVRGSEASRGQSQLRVSVQVIGMPVANRASDFPRKLAAGRRGADGMRTS